MEVNRFLPSFRPADTGWSFFSIALIDYAKNLTLRSKRRTGLQCFMWNVIG